MESRNKQLAGSASGDAPSDDSVRFLQALFEEQDTVLFRPIETWNENGKKQSRVDYKNTLYRVATGSLLRHTIEQLLASSVENRTNLFFGVCPRLGPDGRFDLAWQIRTVRVLWADIDHVTVDEATAKVTAAGLPPPSIVVSTGGGVHLYWILALPYLIDDVGDPPPVETEWTKSSDGRNKSRKYILEHGEKVYLDQRRHLSWLSPKAEHIQNVLAGVAKAVGGDHTTDLSRLLRVPETFNRKDERNGRAPVLAKLVDFEPSRRYSLGEFERFAILAPETERAGKIAAMPLPKVRKVTPATGDSLAQLIAASAVAAHGQRSEADFAVCCFAIRKGISKEEVWSQVESVGKFAEEGKRYFDHTWENAEYEARATRLEEIEQQQQRSLAETHESTGKQSIVVEPATTPVGDTLHQVTDQLLAAGNCFIRSEQLVVVRGDQIVAILSSDELAGLLNQHVEFFFISSKGGEYKPLPPAYTNTWLNQYTERSRLSAIRLFTHNPVYAEDWRLIGPGYDSQSGIYYAGPAVEPRPGSEHLDALLCDFCFKRPADRTNYLGILLTAILVPHFIGSKPAVLFSGNQPELGKSILAQVISILRDGQSAETASYNPNDEEFEKRLGSIVRRGATTIIIDNAKNSGRNPCIESTCLERSITDPILSFRLLGQSASIRAENSHIFCITANTPQVSRDLVTRSVVIDLFYEGDPTRRAFSIADPEGFAHQHRHALLGELIGMVERWKSVGMPRSKTHTRFNKRGWGDIVGGILRTCGEPDFLANADEAADALDETRREFAELVRILVEHPQGNWSCSELYELCKKRGVLSTDLGDRSIRSQTTKLGTLAGRYINERFVQPDGRVAAFHRTETRRGSVYHVAVAQGVPDLQASATPLPDLVRTPGMAP